MQMLYARRSSPPVGVLWLALHRKGLGAEDGKGMEVSWGFSDRDQCCWWILNLWFGPFRCTSQFWMFKVAETPRLKLLILAATVA